MRARAGRLGAARAAGCLGYIPWRMSSRCCLQRAESATLIHADDAAGRLGSGAERRRLSAGRRSPGEDRGRHTAAYNGQRVRPGCMLTMPPEGWDRQRGRRRRSAGRRSPGEDRGPRSGRTGGEPGAGADTCYTPRKVWRRARAEVSAVPVRTGAGAAAPVEDRSRRTSRGPQAES